MSILKVDKALQQDDDALITTSTKDSDPDNAVVTKDYLKKSLAGFKPQNDLDLDKLDERYVGRSKHDIGNHTITFYISNKSKPFANEAMVNGPWINQDGDKIITESIYTDTDQRVYDSTRPAYDLSGWRERFAYIDPRYVGVDRYGTTHISSTKVHDDTNPGHYVITNREGILAGPGYWIRPFYSYEYAYRAALALQGQHGIKYNFVFCFCLDDYAEKENDYTGYGHTSIMPEPTSYGTSVYGNNRTNWTSAGNSNGAIIIDASPFRSLMFKPFRYKYKDNKVIGVEEYFRFDFKPDYYKDSSDNKDNIVNILKKKPESNNRPFITFVVHSDASQFTPPSIFIYGHLLLAYNFAWAIVNTHGSSADTISSSRVKAMSLTAPEKGERSAYLHVMENSILEVNDDMSYINKLRGRQDYNYPETARLFFFNDTPAMESQPLQNTNVFNNAAKTPHASVIDVGKNGKIIGVGGLEVYIASANSKRTSDLVVARSILMSDKIAMSYIYLDKGAMINLNKICIDDPYYYHIPVPTEKGNKAMPDFSLITMDSNSNFGNTGLYFTHFPADLMYRATQGDNDAKSYIATQNMWTSLDSSKLYPSYSSNTNPNKLLKDVHRRVLTWRGPIDFNYDAIHYDIPKETTGNTYPARWSRSLAFYRSKDCGATGTIQYPQRTYMWYILHNPHLDTNSQYGNADSMWNIYLPNILGGDICMIETYDDWLYGAKPVPDAWHMYASDIWVDV